MKLAYFVKPHLGGTYTLFQQLRNGLAPRGIELEWLGLTEADKADCGWADTHQNGILVHSSNHEEDRDKARIMMAALRESRFDGVFVNVLADRVQMNLARYLPPEMLRIMIVHNITPGTYAAARDLRDYVHATVGVSERCRHDLVKHHGFDASRTLAIPNAIELDGLRGAPVRPPRQGPLRLIFLGRLEDASKGIFWLPDILGAVSQPVVLSIVGDGPDAARLAARLSPFGERVKFLGPVAPEEVAGILAVHDILVMPSRFEGFGLTILEAMAAGCIPIVSDIAGVTDMIVENGISGSLFPVGDWRLAAREIDAFAVNPELVEAISTNARARAVTSFDLAGMAAAYHRLLRKVQAERPTTMPPLRLDDWEFPRGMRTSLRSRLPRPLKNWLRVVRERHSHSTFPASA